MEKQDKGPAKKKAQPKKKAVKKPAKKAIRKESKKNTANASKTPDKSLTKSEKKRDNTILEVKEQGEIQEKGPSPYMEPQPALYKVPTGRPTIYSEELADSICDAISMNMLSLRTICKTNGFPVPSTIFRWLEEHQSFRDKYTRAKEMQAEVMAEEILEISDDSTGDVVFTERGPAQNTEFINRSRLRVDARKWLASKILPKKYGDKVDVTSGGEKLSTLPPVVQVFSGAPPMASSEDDITDQKQEY